jgi:hypothetical protein
MTRFVIDSSAEFCEDRVMEMPMLPISLNALRSRRFWRLTAALLCSFVVFAGFASADDDEHDHDKALRAVERGEIRSLDQVLAAVRARMPGDVVGVELEREHGSWIYEFKIIDPAGQLKEVEVDAKTTAILKVEDDD